MREALLLIVILLSPVSPGEGEEPSLDELVASLGAAESADRDRADALLAARGESARSPLEGARTSEDPEVRRRADRLLRRLDLHRDLAPVLRVLPWAEKAILDGGRPGAADVLAEVLRLRERGRMLLRIDEDALAPLVAPALRHAPGEIASLLVRQSFRGPAGLGRHAVPVLLEWSAGHDEVLRELARDLLERFVGSITPTAELRTMLEDRSPRIRARAAGYLGKQGPAARSAVPDLIAALDDAEGSVRESAVEALGLVADEDAALPSIITILDREREDRVRDKAVRALAEIGAARDLVALITAEGDEDAPDRERALDVLSRLPATKAPDLVPLLAIDDAETRVRTLVALGQLGNASVAPDVARLLDAGGSEAVRALATLKTLRAVGQLEAALRHGSADVRAGAVVHLDELRASESLEALRVCVEDPVALVARVAARAVVRLASDPDETLAALAAHRDPSARCEAMRLARRCRREAAMRLALDHASSDADAEVRREAIITATELASRPTAEEALVDEIVSVIIPALDDDVPAVAVEASQALAVIGRKKPATVVSLRRQLAHADESIRQHAAAALIVLDAAEAPGEVSALAELRAAAARDQLSLGASFVAQLIDRDDTPPSEPLTRLLRIALGDRNGRVRHRASRALARAPRGDQERED